MIKKIILGVAVTVIFYGLYGLAGSLSSQEITSDTKEPKEPKTFQIWTLSQDVTKGQMVERNHLKAQQIPKVEAEAKGILRDIELDFVDGTLYKKNLTRGSVLFLDLMINPNQDGYIGFLIAPNRVPYMIKTSYSSVIGGIISPGTRVDILSILTPETLLVESSLHRHKSVSVTPIVIGTKVLQVKKRNIEATRNSPESTEIELIVELTRKQVAELIVAKHISMLEVHKSIGEYQKSDLQADAGDILPGFKSIVEFRADKIVEN